MAARLLLAVLLLFAPAVYGGKRGGKGRGRVPARDEPKPTPRPEGFEGIECKKCIAAASQTASWGQRRDISPGGSTGPGRPCVPPLSAC